MEQKIKIKISERIFELKAESPEKEELFRKGAAMVNSQLNAYQQKFQSKNMTDIFSLVALNECMTIISLKRKQEALEKEVRKLQEDLEGYLKNIDKI